MKAGWKEATVGAVATVSAGNSAPQEDALFQDGTYPFFRTADAGRIRFGDISESTDYLNDSGISGLRLFPKGTILFPKSGASTFLNHRVMLAVDGYVASHLATIVADRTKIHERFLLYYLTTVSAQDLVQDHAYPSLNLPLISGIPVPVPPLPEQQRIVTILDEAFEGIASATANAEKNLRNACELFDRQLQSVFTKQGKDWSDKKLGEVATFRNGINFTKSSRGDSVRIVGVKDFQQHFYAPVDALESVITQGVLPESDLLKQHDVLFVRSNGNLELIGRCLLIGELSEKTTFSGFTIRARLNDSTLLPEYLCHYLKSNFARKTMIEGGNGVNIKSLNQTTLSDLVIPFPPKIMKQRAVVSHLESLSDDVQQLKSVYKQKLTALTELKKSILHQAFTGQLH